MIERLFHISERQDIKVFEPRLSPSQFDLITGDVVFAISDRLMHNYLLQRDCPRVTYYASSKTSNADKATFLNNTDANYIITVEAS
jgi:hypothetical protein